MRQFTASKSLSFGKEPLPLTRQRLETEAGNAGLTLIEDESGLGIADENMVLRGDFAHLIARMKPANLNRELLVRAAKIKGLPAGTRPVAVDATAGLGEDSLLLAAAGFEVWLFERNPVIAALLRDALERALDTPELSDAASHMHVTEDDSITALLQIARQPSKPDVVLLDPMFPAKQKSSAVKKKLQLLQRLEAPCDDEHALLDAALAAHPHKVVIKRPVKGPHLAGRAPSYSLTGKAVRYDCIVLPAPSTAPRNGD